MNVHNKRPSDQIKGSRDGGARDGLYKLNIYFEIMMNDIMLTGGAKGARGQLD